MKSMKETRSALLALVVAPLLALGAGPVQAQIDAGACGQIGGDGGYGPFDYRKERGNPLHLVESAHFTPSVEALVRGNAGTIGADLDYTLRAFPNHHRALVSAMRYFDRNKGVQPPGMRYSMECYFERALKYKPDDVTARMLYAGYLGKHGRRDDALREAGYVAHEAADNPFTHYNLGLVYLELKDYEHAVEQAHQAMALGFPRTELRDSLQAAGKWTEPPAGSASGVAGAASAVAGDANR